MSHESAGYGTFFHRRRPARLPDGFHLPCNRPRPLPADPRSMFDTMTSLSINLYKTKRLLFVRLFVTTRSPHTPRYVALQSGTPPPAAIRRVGRRCPPAGLVPPAADTHQGESPPARWQSPATKGVENNLSSPTDSARRLLAAPLDCHSGRNADWPGAGGPAVPFRPRVIALSLDLPGTIPRRSGA